MNLAFRVSGRISKPVHEVFEAVADPKHLSGYFTTGGAVGRLETGATVTWDFHDFPGAFPVEVVEVVPDQKIVLRWDASEATEPSTTGEAPQPVGYKTTVTMEFTGLEDGRTLVTISESGWRQTPGGLKSSYGNCEGWTGMLCGMKVYLEYGINFRTGFYK
ncbi:SRPBCC domain-containing protein [Devosia rhizoryzae]|uniref:SRPBCC domain-containing protein n=1 Tax=Devosia rhizoryzae TaxID=2774137 RepID=A0ABX7CA29_9HYPH|nr:SRPBCC domain-containing protein [Devosia rhizoryzae]QQR41071.1 SRPBCC domain-containing protein [Devosia rhizoryzae]